MHLDYITLLRYCNSKMHYVIVITLLPISGSGSVVGCDSVQVMPELRARIPRDLHL